MERIADTMAVGGYEVLLVGRKLTESISLIDKIYTQKRLPCFFRKGFLFYLEYNLRLFLFLLFQKADILCAIDLDTILPVYLVSLLKKQKRVYDAHELFTEQKEVISRKWVHAFWLAVEKFAVPRFPKGYTVNLSIVNEFANRYKVYYGLVRNLPRFYPLPPQTKTGEKWFLYQGAVNEGRCFETLLPAMKKVPAKLVICGGGNFMETVKALIIRYELGDKIELRGYLPPAELKQLTSQAHAGITLFEREGMNQYYSLANRFFDYTMAGIPQICVNYPEYAGLNREYAVASLVDDTGTETIALALNNLLSNDVLYQSLRQNTAAARMAWNWEQEKASLLAFYKAL